MAEIEHVRESVQQLDLIELCNVPGTSVKVRVRVLSRFEAVDKPAAVAFHDKCPIAPNRASAPDVIGDVKQTVDGKCTDANTMIIILVVYSDDILVHVRRRMSNTYLSNSSTHATNPVSTTSSSSSDRLSCRHLSIGPTRATK